MELFDQETAGLFGVVTETGTTARTGPFALILCMSATTFSAFTEANGSGSAMTGFAIPAGTTIRGRISAFTLTSGSVRAHKAGPLG
jgi:hypothetical protein